LTGLLSGIRVTDFSWAQAGPFVTEILALMGCEVIKIENRKRPDVLRVVSAALGLGDGEEVEFQLVKTYTSGNIVYTRKITKPVAGSVKVYINDVETTDYSLDYTTGILTFDNAPEIAEVITVDFEFDVPVRFDTDFLEISMESLNLGKVKDIVLLEIKE